MPTKNYYTIPGYFLRRRCLVFFLCGLFSTNLVAQVNATIQLTAVPANLQDDAVYVAGNFNEWNPADSNFRFIKNSDGYFLTLPVLNAGLVAFKFTRGSWEKVECTANGKDVSNHTIELVADTVLKYNIDAWKDQFVSPVKTHTASENVHMVDTAFVMPQLNRNRRIWIYLPPGYETSKQKYPVIYMQDGQNLFDEFTAPYGEWGVDECLDSMIANGSAAAIIVGIDNGGSHRMSEYNPFEFTWKDSVASETFLPEGDAYLNFIVHSLKPFIDMNYRTVGTKENTFIAGSSMGGLIAYYAVMKYPAVFGKAGVFSPAFWTADGIDNLTDSLAGKLKGKYFFYIGAKEGERYVDDMIRIQEKLGENSKAVIYSVIDPDAEHNEKAWRKWFPEFYKWVMAKGFNIAPKRKR